MSEVTSEPKILKDWILKKMDYRMIWKKRFFILSGSQLIYYKDAADSGPRNIYYLDDTYKIVDYSTQSEMHQFAIYQGSQRLLWLAAEDNKAKLWISEIQNQITQCVYQKSTTHLNTSINRSYSLNDSETSPEDSSINVNYKIPSSCLDIFNTLRENYLEEANLIKAADGCLFYSLPRTNSHPNYTLCSTFVNCRIEHLFPLLMDYKQVKQLWSPCFFRGELIEKLNSNTDVLHYILKPTTLTFSPILVESKYLDACLIRYWVCIDQTYYIIMSSITHPNCPLNKHYRRVQISVAYKVEPVDNTKVSLSQIVCINPDGVLNYFPGIVKLFVQTLLSSTPGLACYLSQIPDYHIYALLESLRNAEDTKFTKDKSEGICMDCAIDTIEETNSSLYISNSIPHAIDSKRDSYWEECTSITWKVRGPTYMNTREKIPSQPGYCQILAVDIFKSEQKIEHIASYPEYSIHKIKESNIHLPESSIIFVINLQMTINTPVSISCMFVIPTTLPEDTQSLSLLKKYLASGKEFRDSRFKMIPTIEEGGFLVRKAVGTTPVLLGKKGTSAYYSGNTPYPYFEVDFDMDSNSVAKNLSKMMFGNTKNMVLDLAFLIQGDSPSELPERILGSFRLVHIDMANAISLQHK